MATYDEYVKFKVNKPEAQRELKTIEIYHPSNGEIIRLVQDLNEYQAYLESTAPRNPSELVTFSPFAGEIVDSQYSNEAEQAITINIADLNSDVQAYLDTLDGIDWFTPIEVVYRKYWSGDNSHPAIPAQYLFATSPSFETSDGDIPILTTFVASDVDLSQKRAGILYDTRSFPGLA